MNVTHELTIFGKCPVDDATDVYEVRVSTNGLLEVERILAVVAALEFPMFQEDVTKKLAERLQCRVTTIGYHKGVKTTCAV